MLAWCIITEFLYLKFNAASFACYCLCICVFVFARRRFDTKNCGDKLSFCLILSTTNWQNFVLFFMTVPFKTLFMTIVADRK